MNFLTRKHLDRRTMLKGMGGAAIALPFLDAMMPVGLSAAPKKLRLVAMEMVHGSAGSTAFGLQKNLWAPRPPDRPSISTGRSCCATKASA